MTKLVSIAEVPEFIRQASRLLSAEERAALVEFLAENPRAGVVIQGTGGVRKLRWARAGRGKSAGVRAIYYFYNEAMPLYLLTLFGKNEKADLTAAERNELAGLVRILKTAAENEQ